MQYAIDNTSRIQHGKIDEPANGQTQLGCKGNAEFQ